MDVGTKLWVFLLCVVAIAGAGITPDLA